MIAIWDIYAIAEMSNAERAHNSCRQLEQEVCDWGRRLGYRGLAVRMGEQYTGEKRIGLICKGRRVTVYLDDKPTGPAIIIKPGAADILFAAIQAAMEQCKLPSE